jgi:hypothetical protein
MGEENVAEAAEVAVEEGTVEEATGEAAKGLAEVATSDVLKTMKTKTTPLDLRMDPRLLHQADDV